MIDYRRYIDDSTKMKSEIAVDEVDTSSYVFYGSSTYVERVGISIREGSILREDFHTHPPEPQERALMRGYPRELIKRMDFTQMYPSPLDYLTYNDLLEFFEQHKGKFIRATVGCKTLIDGTYTLVTLDPNLIPPNIDLIERMAQEERGIMDEVKRGQYTLDKLVSVFEQDIRVILQKIPHQLTLL